MGRHSESTGGGVDKGSSHRSSGHHRHRHHHHRRHHRDNEAEQPRKDADNNNNDEIHSRSRHHRRRHSHRHRRSDSDSDDNHDNDNSYSWRSRSNAQREEERDERSDRLSRLRRRARLERQDSRNHADNNNDDAQRSRKRRRNGDDDDSSDRASDKDARDGGPTLQDRLGRHPNSGTGGSGNTYTSSDVVDWSSRRGRRQMPSLAYDVGQQRRFLGFLDRRDASGGRAAATAAAMTFEIGPDGLVQMPPPNTLVRHQHSRRRRGEQEQPLRCTDDKAKETGVRHERNKGNTTDDDDAQSVASHESLYNDPATAHLGVLPDVLPPSNLYRVALYGVDLSITADHLNSIVTQLLGKAAKPYRMRRPAREMLLAAMAFSDSNTKVSTDGTAAAAAATSAKQSASLDTKAPIKPSASASSSGVLQDNPNHAVDPASAARYAPAGGVLTDDAPAAVLSTAPSSGILPETTAVLQSEDAESGVLGSGGAQQLDAAEVYEEERNSAEEMEEGVLPDVSSLPQPPPPAAPAFYLPGLHDVNGPGGMVVLEFAEREHAFRTVQVLNGGYINGRRIAASM
ncbi:hypothetical protein N2W54_007090 [Lotmaria passim]